MNNTTSRLRLPYILASQAQKEITHNEALAIIDVLLHASAITIGESVPSDEEAKHGDCHVIGELPEGVWANHPNALAYYTTDWNFIEACEGMTVWVRKTRCHYTYDGSKWHKSSHAVADIECPQIGPSSNDTAVPEKHAELTAPTSTKKPAKQKNNRLQVVTVAQEMCANTDAEQDAYCAVDDGEL